jgi:regulator of sigma E protease
MSFLSGFAGGLWGFLFMVLAFLFVLSIVVFIHELGHFLVARWCGVTVKVFSIGFGREIAGFNDRHGTRWRFAWVPLGGYVKFMDDENAASVPAGRDRAMTAAERAGAFHSKPLWQRAAVVAAGPLANFLLAIVIFALMFMLVGIRTTAAIVDEVVADTPAAAAGFRAGDRVVEIDGRRIDSFNDLQRIVSQSAGRTLTFVLERDGQRITTKAAPAAHEENDRMGGTYKLGRIGIKRTSTAQTVIVKKAGPLESVWLGVKETQFIITSTVGYLVDVVRGRQDPSQLGGPVRIAHVSGEVAKLGLQPLINFIAVISVSVGLINLFPIPLLDGGHLLFYGIEALRGRPLSERSQEIGFRIGLAIVLFLMVFAFWNDRLIPTLWIKGSG